MVQKIRDWLEVRIGFEELIRSQLTEYRVPNNISIFCTLGMVAFAAFLIQVGTGILLIFYYIPDEKDAFQSVQFIMNQVPVWLAFSSDTRRRQQPYGGGGPRPHGLDLFLRLL